MEEESARAALHALERRQGASHRAEAALLRALQEQVKSSLALTLSLNLALALALTLSLTRSTAARLRCEA